MGSCIALALGLVHWLKGCTEPGVSARDLLLLPNLLSLSRVPLSVLFLRLADRPKAAFAVIAASGASDILDGYIARSRGQVTALGTMLDALTDKLFAVTVAMSLVRRKRLSPGALPWLVTREMGEAPLVLWLLFSARGRRAGRVHRANVLGKLTTGLQAATLGAALFRSRATRALLAASGATGALSAASYWRRAITAPTASSPRP